MYYNDQQFNELAKYEVRFTYAIHSSTKGPGEFRKSDLERIMTIHREATGSAIRASSFCGECIVRILRIVGAAYFSDKEERTERANAEAVKHEVSTSEEVIAPQKKTVKTATKSPKKKASK